MAEVPPSADRRGDDVNEGSGGSGPSLDLSPAQIRAEIEDLRSVGRANGKDEWTRTVFGDAETARRTFDRYVDQETVRPMDGVSGGLFGRVAGTQGTVSYRPTSKSGSPAVGFSGLSGWPKGELKLHYVASP
jgi:hypothetical protein